MKTFLTLIGFTFVFIVGYGFGVISEPPAPPKECKVIKIDYNPEYDEPDSVWYKGKEVVNEESAEDHRGPQVSDVVPRDHVRSVHDSDLAKSD